MTQNDWCWSAWNTVISRKENCGNWGFTGDSHWGFMGIPPKRNHLWWWFKHHTRTSGGNSSITLFSDFGDSPKRKSGVNSSITLPGRIFSPMRFLHICQHIAVSCDFDKVRHFSDYSLSWNYCANTVVDITVTIMLFRTQSSSVISLKLKTFALCCTCFYS